MFRKEVLNARQGDWLVPIRLAMPVSYRILAAGAFLASLLLVSVLTFSGYTSHESAHGTIVPKAVPLVIRTMMSGACRGYSTPPALFYWCANHWRRTEILLFRLHRRLSPRALLTSIRALLLSTDRFMRFSFAAKVSSHSALVGLLRSASINVEDA